MIARPQRVAVNQRLAAGKLVARQNLMSGGAKEGAALLVGQAQHRDAVDAEEEGLKGRLEGREVGKGVDDAGLQGWGVGDLEEGVDIVEVGLPQAKHLGLLRVQGAQVDLAAGRAKEEVVVGVVEGLVAVCTVPGVLDDRVAKVGAVTVVLAVAIGVLAGGQSTLGRVGGMWGCGRTGSKRHGRGRDELENKPTRPRTF